MAASPLKIISGGQTGVDRAALDAALATGLPTGGWCPLGRLAEDGTIPNHYPLTEAPSPEPAVRTEMNVIHSDGTLIITPAYALTEGTLYTLQMTIKHQRPCLLTLIKENNTPTAIPTTSNLTVIRATHQQMLTPTKKITRKVIDWLRENNIHTLNVAGPRESKVPGIYRVAISFLSTLFEQLTSPPSKDKDCDDAIMAQSPHPDREK